jgi:hypothetical protein
MSSGHLENIVEYLLELWDTWPHQDPARKKRQKKRRQMSKQTCKAGTEKEEKWKICVWQICCPRNQKIDRRADRQSTDLQILGHPSGGVLDAFWGGATWGVV